MIGLRDLVVALQDLGIDHSTPVIAHASLSAFGEVLGGAETVIGALLYLYDTLVMPTFTYKTMIVPEEGPPSNALAYGSRPDANLMAEFYSPTLAADRLMGIIPERLRRHPAAQRSMHPILSFAGVNAREILASQSLEEPLAPIRRITDAHGWVLLLGVDHTTNTSIHYAERLAGRKQFVRWALTPQGVMECPSFPGCSDGFNAVAPLLAHATRRSEAGQAAIQAVPLQELVEIVQTRIRSDPLAFLCNHSYCERCQAVRDHINKNSPGLAM